MKNILITGCTGTLGQTLVKNLTFSNYKVIGIARKLKEFKFKKTNFKLITLDLADEKLLLKALKDFEIDIVIHAAALIPKKLRDKDLERVEMFKSNVYGTFNVLRLMEKKNIKNIISVSSMAVYGFPQYLPVNEKHALAPLTFYGLTKKHAEEYIKQMSGKSGFSACIFRFPSFFSPKIKAGAMYSFCTKALTNKEIVINLTSPVCWDVLHIDDAQSVIIKAIERMKNNGFKRVEVFNVDYSVPINIIKIANKIVKLTNSKSSIKKIGQEKSIDFFFDVKKLKKMLRWTPPSLEERIKEYIKKLSKKIVK